MSQYNRHYNKTTILFLFSIVFAFAHNVSALTLPPWRGIRQILSIGPWGLLFDKLETPTDRVLYVDSKGSTLDLSSASLLPPYSSSSHRRIVAISDTHGKHRSLSIPQCDVLCHCGDVLQRYGYIGSCGGGLPALLDFCSWLKDDIPSTTSKIVIGGNHDVLFENLGDEKVKLLLNRSGAVYLRDESIMVSNLVFYGSPWSPKGGTGNRAFQRGLDADEEVVAAQNTLKRREKDTKDSNQDKNSHIDVLLTHARGAAWESLANHHFGPRFWAHGHWHDGHGRTSLLEGENGKCISVNVASNDMIYRLVNPPVVFDVPLRTSIEREE